MMSQKPAATAAAGTSNNYDDEEDTPSCWICLDDGSEEPLRRECACRGAAGWAHLSCLSDYAMAQSKDILQRIERGACAAEDIGHFVFLGEPWRLCSNCKQDHGPKMKVDLSIEFAERAKDYPDNELMGLSAQFLLAESHSDREMEKILRRILVTINAKGVSLPLRHTMHSRDFEGEFRLMCLVSLGDAYREQKKYAQALKTLEEARAMAKEQGKPFLLSSIDNLTAKVKGSMGIQPTSEEAPQLVNVLRKEIAGIEAVLGANHAGTFHKRHELAYYLFHLGDEERVESFQILEDIEQRCKAVFGADHPETIKAANQLAKARRAQAERERMKTKSTKSRRSKKKKSSAPKNQESDKHAAKTEEEADAAAAALLAELDLDETKKVQRKTKKRRGKKKK